MTNKERSKKFKEGLKPKYLEAYENYEETSGDEYFDIFKMAVKRVGDAIDEKYGDAIRFHLYGRLKSEESMQRNILKAQEKDAEPDTYDEYAWTLVIDEVKEDYITKTNDNDIINLIQKREYYKKEWKKESEEMAQNMAKNIREGTTINVSGMSHNERLRNYMNAKSVVNNQVAQEILQFCISVIKKYQNNDYSIAKQDKDGNLVDRVKVNISTKSGYQAPGSMTFLVTPKSGEDMKSFYQEGQVHTLETHESAKHGIAAHAKKSGKLREIPDLYSGALMGLVGNVRKEKLKKIKPDKKLLESIKSKTPQYIVYVGRTNERPSYIHVLSDWEAFSEYFGNEVPDQGERANALKVRDGINSDYCRDENDKFEVDYDER
jgi:hypothetical protein